MMVTLIQKEEYIMIRTLDMSMLNIAHDARTMAPLAAAQGFEAISITPALLADETTALEATAFIRDHGLKWGLLPLTADYYFWDVTDEQFDQSLIELTRRAKIAEKIGIRHAYNHVWPTSFREFDENFDWHVNRVRRVSDILHDHGVRYGLEFLGPHELRRWNKHEFVHSLAGVLAIADAAGGKTGIAFDTYHWYCSTAGCPDDVLYMTQHTDRLVAVHLNDAPAGIAVPDQKDMQRCLPMTTGVIDSAAILAGFMKHDNDALYMVEPFEPTRTLFGAMTAEEAAKTAGAAMERVLRR